MTILTPDPVRRNTPCAHGSEHFGPRPERPTSHLSDLYQYALIYRGWGWSVFPVLKKRPAVRAEAWWGPPDKDGDPTLVKLTGWKEFQSRRPTDNIIRQMFDAHY